MAICCFIGHSKVYDGDIDDRLQAAVGQVMAAAEAVEFWLYTAGNDEFFNRCLLAVMRAQTSEPDRVRIRFVQRRAQEDALTRLFDGVIVPPFPEKEHKNGFNSGKRERQWMVKEATHVIRYIYDTLYDASQPVIRTRSGQTLIDITSAETEAAILAYAAAMPEKARSVFQTLCAGGTLLEAGAALGVSQERARQLLQHGCREPRRQLHLRAAAARREWGDTRERACGLFSLGEPTDAAVGRLKRYVGFLMTTFDIKKFYIEQAYIDSAFTAALMQAAAHVVPRIIGVVSGRDQGADDLWDRYCPPCNAVLCVSSAEPGAEVAKLAVLNELTMRPHFCICDLSAENAAERAAIARKNGAVLLDLSIAT